MEIHKTDGQPTVKDYKLKGKKDSGALGSGGSVDAVQGSFLDELKRLTLPDGPETQSTNLDDLMADLDQQGRKFQERPILEELVKYKALVKRFLEITLKQALKPANHSGRRRLNSPTPKDYQIIEVVDKKLTELTMAVLEKENKNINLASRLDEIRGLLLDLYR
jgi:uncharacterized protein YaaR (DUF327 family)